jgi:general secretion pathway protein D
MNNTHRALWVALMLGVLLQGCAGYRSHREGQLRLDDGDLEGGLRMLAQAVKEAPDNVTYRQALRLRREAITNDLLQIGQAQIDAGAFDAAQATFERVLNVEASNSRALAGLDRVGLARRHAVIFTGAQQSMNAGQPLAAQDKLNEILRENPADRRASVLLRQAHAALRAAAGTDGVSPKLRSSLRQPVSLVFREATLMQVVESMKQAAGVNFIFDKDVRTDTRVSLAVTNKSLEDVLRVLMAGQRLAYKVLDEDTLLLYPNTPEKARDYQELVIRTFYLGNADATKVLAMTRNIVKVRDAHVDEKLNALVIRDTAEMVRLAERVISNLDVAEPEVMLELEVLEVSANKLRELGIRYPDSISGTVSGAAGAGQLTAAEFRNRSSGLVSYAFSNPLLVVNLKQSVGDASLLANPRIRIKNKTTAKVLVGERVPVITTIATANVGTSESVSYLDVGLKLELEPTVALDDDVSMKVALEVSNIVGTITRSSGLQAFRLGTRNASTTLRVRDGETQVLAGLIQLEDRRAAANIPGLGDLPVLGRLFSNTATTDTRTEIVLLITPRVVRNLNLPGIEQLEINSGTESALGATPLQLRPTQVPVAPFPAPRSGSGAPGIGPPPGSGPAGALPAGSIITVPAQGMPAGNASEANTNTRAVPSSPRTVPALIAPSLVPLSPGEGSRP